MSIEENFVNKLTWLDREAVNKGEIQLGFHELIKMLGVLPWEPIQSPSYVVWSDGLTPPTYYAKNGTTGEIEFSGTDATTVAQSALDQLTTGGELHFKNGTFVFTNSLWNQNLDYVTISGEGFSTVIKPDTVRESTLTAQANAGAGTLAVADGTQFKINQQIVCGTKDYTTVDKDWRRITNIVGNVLTLDSVLTFTHLNGAPVWTAYRCIEAAGADGLIIENLKIDGNKANQYYYSQANAVCVGSVDKIFRVQNGVYLYQCDLSILRNTYTDNIAGWGGIVVENSDYCTIDSCITNNGVNHGVILFNACILSSITNCHSSTNGGATTALGHGICVEACYRVTVNGNTANSNYLDGFYIWGTGGEIVVSNNVAYNNPYGINAGSISGSIITGNTIRAYSATIAVIGIKSYGQIQISNNKIYLMNKVASDGYGISVSSGAASLNEVLVSDNVISRWSGTGYFDPNTAIYMRGTGSSESQISNNIITGSYASAGITYYASATPYQNQKITDNVLNIAITPYGINIESIGVDMTNSITDNIITGATTPIRFVTATNKAKWGINKNTGYIEQNEPRSAFGSLTPGNANAICFAWHNSEGQDIIIKKVVIEVTTGGGTVGSHLDVGIADDAAGTNRGVEFFDDLLLNTAQVDDSWVVGDGGTQTKWVFCEDLASAIDGWVVGQILDANAANLVGKYYIEYVGR